MNGIEPVRIIQVSDTSGVDDAMADFRQKVANAYGVPRHMLFGRPRPISSVHPSEIRFTDSFDTEGGEP